MNQSHAIFLLASALLLSCAFASEYIRFGYSGNFGPDKWGTLSPSSRACSDGKNQSPIDIVRKDAVPTKELRPIDNDYFSNNAFLINDGFKILLRFDGGAGNLVLDGNNYTLIDLHWHIPSEHTIDGEVFAMELQMVHKGGADGQIVVVSVLYQSSNTEDAFLLQLRDELGELVNDKCTKDQVGQITSNRPVQMRSLQRRSRKYYRYAGSLTHPPCTENINWVILAKVRKVTQKQLDALQAPLGRGFKRNARPTQPLNGRTVQVFEEKNKD